MCPSRQLKGIICLALSRLSMAFLHASHPRSFSARIVCLRELHSSGHEELYDVKERLNLTETVLRGKMEDFCLEQAKRKVLQDMLLKSTKASERQQKEWQDKLDKLENHTQQLEDSLYYKRRQFKKDKQRWLAEKKELEEEFDNTLQALEKERSRALHYRQKYEEETSRSTRLQTEEVIRLERQIKNLENELSIVEEQLDAERIQRESRRKIEEEKTRKLEDELLTANDELRRAIEDYHQNESKEAESVEIAKAAVAAAERREAEAVNKCESLQCEIKEQRAVVTQLQEELQRYSLESKNMKAQTEIEELNEQIRLLKSTHGSEMRAQRKAAEKMATAVAEKYQRELQRIRNAALSGKFDSPSGSRPPAGVWNRVRRTFSR